MSQKYIPPHSKTVFHGVRFDVNALTLSTPEGKQVKREVVIHPGAVIILPLLDENQVVLIQNERFAVGKKLWELPAGTLEPNETPLETAKRELEEETGYSAKTVTPLTEFYTTPGFCNEKMYAFLAKDLTHLGQKLDPSEKITVSLFPWTKVLKMIQEGEICDGKTIATLLFFTNFKK